MTKRLIFGILFLVSALGLWSVVQATDSAGDMYFSNGVQKYLKSDLDGAIQDLDVAMSMDKGNVKTKAFLVKILVEKGTEFYLRKDYGNALPYLTRAHDLVPEDNKVTQMYNMADAALHPQPVAAVSSPTGAPGGYAVPAPGNMVPGAKNDEVMVNLFSTFQKQQEKLIDTVMGPQQVLKEMISTTDKERLQLFQNMNEERKKMIEILNKKDETMVNTFQESQNMMRRTMTYGIIGFVAIIIAVIFFIYLIISYVSTRREAAMMKYQEKILGIIQDQSMALTQGQSRLMLGNSTAAGNPMISTREMISDINPHIRAKGIEVIEAELVKEMDPEVATKLLSPFLDDPDNRVRANAAKALYDFDKPRALETLREMAESDDKWMRISAAWAYGEIGSVDTIEFLFKLSEDSEYHVKRRAFKALAAILQTKGEVLPDEIKQRMNISLSKDKEDVQPV